MTKQVATIEENGGRSEMKDVRVSYAIATGKLDLDCACGHRLGRHMAFGPSRCGECECRRARFPKPGYQSHDHAPVSEAEFRRYCPICGYDRVAQRMS